MARTLLLKLSGEALGDGKAGAFRYQEIERVCREIISARGDNRIALVVGGGNIMRGSQLKAVGGDPCRGDYMGMLATLINALALQDAVVAAGQACEVVAPQAIANVAHAYNRSQVHAWLDAGVIVIFGGGTGHPFFTTDTTAALRAAEIGADELLKGSNVNGIYNDDPRENPDAICFDQISFDDVIKNQYRVMDQTAFALCREQQIPIRVFNMTTAGAIAAALGPTAPGTIVSQGSRHEY